MLARAHVAPSHDTFARLTLNATLAERPRAIAFVEERCRVARLPLDCEHAVISAFGEAFNNVVLHSYRGLAGLCDIEVEERHDRIVVRVRDSGIGFDPRRLHAPTADALPEGGMGVFIILRAMDEASWYREGGENVVHMVKRIPRR
jgi:serine/threonine-protein kinase RsbW